MNVQRLEKLAKHLRTLPVSRDLKFDMGTWFGREFQPTITSVVEKDTLVTKGNVCTVKKVTEKSVEEGFCHTSACILGHAAIGIPEFQRAGLKVDFDDNDPDGKGYRFISGHVVFKGESDEDAGALFFGLEDHEANALFHGDFTTPLQGAKHIEKLIADYKKEKAR